MEGDKLCKHCQKRLKADYHFCPYCGSLNFEGQLPKFSVESEIVEDHENLDRLDVLEACLNTLDSEISRFLSTK